jgi:hypothetical protein
MVMFGITAKTDEARCLVDGVQKAVEAWETAKCTRTRKRTPKASASLRIALESIIAAAIRSADDGTAGRVFRSMSEATWSKTEPVGFLTMKTAFQGMAGAGLLVKIKPGYFRRFGFGGSAGKGMAARWQATPRFRSLIASAGIRSGQAREHFSIAQPSEPIVVKAAKTKAANGKKFPGASLPVPNTPHAKHLRQEVEEIDAYLSRHKLQGGSHDGYRRVFNDGDRDGFAFDRGGRLQSVGAKSYQNLPAKDRLNMRIGGKPVVEIDIRASQFSILHAVNHPKRKLPEDLYVVDGLPRDIVKAWVTIALGKQSFPKRWPSEWKTKLKDMGVVVAKYPVKAVGEKITERFPFLHRLADFWPSTTLQYFESNIIVATMLRLLRDHDVPSLAMHDGIIVRASDEDVACRALEAVFEKTTRVKPRLTVDRD